MATLEAIQERIKKLQTQADALIAKKAQVAVDQIRKLMIQHGLTTEHIEATAKARREAKLLKEAATEVKRSAKKKAKASGATVAKPLPKYQDKKTGATWSGYGRAPAWIASAKDRTKFLIAAEALISELPHVTAAAVKKVAGKKVAVKKVAAKKAAAKKGAAKKAATKTPATKKVAVKKTSAAAAANATTA